MASASAAAAPAAEKLQEAPASDKIGSTTVQAMVRLQHQPLGPLSGTNEGVAVTISHTLGSAVDGANGGGASDERRRYAMCSLLLQVGNILGVRPSHAPSPRLSSIFDMLLEKWRLSWNGGDIDALSDIDDGDELVLCCGDYARATATLATGEVDLLGLIPSRYNAVAVSLAATSLENEGNAHDNEGHANDIDEGRSEHAEAYSEADDGDEREADGVEVVTGVHRPQPEVIDLLEDSSDDESECCFWEYDAHGHMRRKAAHLPRHAAARAASTGGRGRNDDAGEDHEERMVDIESISSDDSDDSSVEDVTDVMMAKRKEQAEKMRNEAEEIADDSDQDGVENIQAAGKKRKQKSRSQSTAKRRRRAKKRESPIEVLIDEKDIPVCPGAKTADGDDGGSSGGAGDSEVDHTIKQRIVKLLNTGFHGESNEHEARNAMKLARRLMERHNLDQAVLMQERGDGSLNDFSTNDDDEGSTLQGGVVTAKIRNRKKQTPLSSLPRWHDFLVQPVCMNFHVEAFKTLARGTPHRAGECSVTFYGIRTNVQLAAYAFKIASERIAFMAAEYEPVRCNNLSRAQQVAETRTARLSYALGIVKGLQRDVEEGLRKEEEKRKSRLRKAQQAAATQTGEAYHEDSPSDDEENKSDEPCGKAANESGGQSQVSHDQSSPDTEEHVLDKLEKEHCAHLALVDHHKKVASDVLKSKNIKVRSARKHKSISLNRKAYEKGVVDSQEIDLNQQVIRE